MAAWAVAVKDSNANRQGRPFSAVAVVSRLFNVDLLDRVRVGLSRLAARRSNGTKPFPLACGKAWWFADPPQPAARPGGLAAMQGFGKHISKAGEGGGPALGGYGKGRPAEAARQQAAGAMPLVLVVYPPLQPLGLGAKRGSAPQFRGQFPAQPALAGVVAHPPPLKHHLPGGAGQADGPGASINAGVLVSIKELPI